MYRPPGTNLVDFTKDCNEFLDKICIGKVKTYIAGDFNINLLNYQSHLDTSNFLNIAFDHYLCPVLTRPTRFSQTSSTLIDNIFINSTDDNFYAGLFINDMSDHLPIFYISSEKYSTNVCNVKKYCNIRIVTDCTIQQFQNSLLNVDWSMINMCNDANTSYDIFF